MPSGNSYLKIEQHPVPDSDKSVWIEISVYVNADDSWAVNSGALDRALLAAIPSVLSASLTEIRRDAPEEETA